MNKKLKSVLVVVFAFAFSYFGMYANTYAAIRRLSEINASHVCTHQHPGTTAFLGGSTVVDWFCSTAFTGATRYSLSMYNWCVYKHGSNANTSYDDWWDPYSWYCYEIY